VAIFCSSSKIVLKVDFMYRVLVNGLMYEVHSESKFRFNLKKIVLKTERKRKYSNSNSLHLSKTKKLRGLLVRKRSIPT
jgi:hypothetical protein